MTTSQFQLIVFLGDDSGDANQGPGLGLCMCHLDTTSGCKLSTNGFLCPQVLLIMTVLRRSNHWLYKTLKKLHLIIIFSVPSKILRATCWMQMLWIDTSFSAPLSTFLPSSFPSFCLHRGNIIIYPKKYQKVNVNWNVYNPEFVNCFAF